MAVATNVELPRLIVRRICADGTAIPKGTVMKLSGDNTVIASAADNDPFGGIAVEEKTASDGIVNIGCAIDGAWDIDTTAAAITAGAVVNIGAANQVSTSAAADLLTGSVVGNAETTRTGTNRIRVRLRGY